ncbi:MAG TPA: cobyrinate a,c-diamide synthase [Nitrospiraceae bacterium]|nr:cobyrinate a,c-diamide synthase [Nitrospiraceae bacterium]
MHYPRFVIAGTHSGVGKTTFTLALLAALQRRGRRVQAFKVGPDFIDPGHHTLITGRPSRNLDGWMLGQDLNRQIFCGAAADADLSIVEGMMGLFDGSSSTNEIGSTAELAKQLQAPVLLIIDGSAMARSAAAMALGYARFDPNLHVGGVLFNRIGGEGHYRLLKEAVESTTDIPVLGYLKPDAAVSIPDRHLGIATAIEQGSSVIYESLARAASETVDLNRVEAIAHTAKGMACESANHAFAVRAAAEGKIRIGVAYDAAFCFYYAENLELLKAAGAELIYFSPLRDQALPNVDLLYLGGGYPEVHASRLADNAAMRRAIGAFASQGGAIYAECGGLMYLTQSILDGTGQTHAMVGVFPANAVMRPSGFTIGYRELELTRPCLLGEGGLKAKGHEFHYSALTATGTLDYACQVTNVQGDWKGQDGLMVGNTLALYTHVHFASQPRMAEALVAAVRKTIGRLTPVRGEPHDTADRS